MLIKLFRNLRLADCTIGQLFISDSGSDVFECFTLEDVVRPDGVKIKHQTAIPAGRYEVVIDFSNKYQRRMPHILNVPMFSGIRIHSGNVDTDTSGCILVGTTFNQANQAIYHSRDAYDRLFEKMLKADKIQIWIDNDFNFAGKRDLRRCIA